MRKSCTFLFVIICFCFPVKLAALSGVYTIDNTIPSSISNYTSFTAFANDLNANGVSGPVIVNVIANTVFNEQINFIQAPGISAVNSVTINGNGSTLSFNATVATMLHTMLLSGADYMTFNNLRFIGTGPQYALTVHLWNSADNNTFNNCTFDSPIVGTVTTLCPFSVSGTSVSPTATGLSGNNNTVKTCTATGGYYGTAFSGNAASPFNIDNSVLDSYIKDFYQSGCYNAYCQGSTFKGNLIERQNRVTVTTSYGIICTTGSINSLIDGNFIQKLFNNIVGSASTCYPIYVLGAATLNNENVIRNNVISDINSNGIIIGIFISGGSYANVFHNTVSLDDVSAAAGTTYGIQSTSPNNKIRNNIITVGRGGSGAKYGLYLTAAATGLQSDFNVIYMSSLSGTGNLPFFLVSGYSLPLWQLAYPAYDQSSIVTDPIYTNPALLNYVPTSTVINNMCPFIGVTADVTGFIRSTATPDPGAYEMYITPCSGAAAPNSVVTPSYVLCPNTTLNIALASTFTNTGYSMQWQSSNSVFGPYTAISGATLPSFNTGLLATTIYYNVLISCANGGGTVTATAGTVLVAPPIIDNVPYFEGFEGINFNNELPNCSWYTAPGSGALTYTSSLSGNRYAMTGVKFGSFASTASGPTYVYSNGINLLPGITYSAALWYINDPINYYPWSDLSILLGTSQSTNGLSSIASTTAATFAYNLLSNTFTVGTAGVYYIAVRATSAPGSSPYLSWDNLSVTIPCQLNSPELFVNSLGTTICSNKPLTLNATGADTYEWTSNLTNTMVISTGSVTIVNPASSTTYYVSGTSTLSGCTSSLSQVITVLPAPALAIFAPSLSICEGESTSLSAQGAVSYNWSHGVLGTPITVTPTITTTYSVVGVATNGCSSLQTIVINVNALPTVSATVSSYQLCKGDNVTLTGSGASSYQWSSASSLVQFGNPLVTTVQSSGGYTMTGTDVNGCSGSAKFVIDVDACTGINELVNQQNDISAYPNPTAGFVKISANGAEIKSVDVFDATGRIIFSDSIKNSAAEINISQLPNGIYSVKVNTGETVKYLKIIKAQ